MNTTIGNLLCFRILENVQIICPEIWIGGLFYLKQIAFEIPKQFQSWILNHLLHVVMDFCSNDISELCLAFYYINKSQQQKFQ